MAIPNRDVCQRWLAHLQQNNIPPERLSGGTVFIRERALIYRRTQSGWSNNAFEAILAEYIPRSKLILLNGNGMSDRRGTEWQTFVRQSAQMNRDGRELAIVPFAALEAAGVDRATIRAIHVVTDENELVFNEAPTPPPIEKMMMRQEGTHSRIYEGKNKDGQLFMVNWPATRVFTNKETKEVTRQQPQSYYGVGNLWDVAYEFVEGSHVQYFLDALHVRANFIFRMTEQERKERQERIDATNRQILAGQRWRGEIIRADFPPTDGKWYREESVHHLGACLFSAVGEDGRRHKFLSAFDEGEDTGAMYFLAQLPDGSGANTYDEAIKALAPPLVHEALKQGRNVRRQGDVFAIETYLTDEQVYALSRTRVRRAVALFDYSQYGHRITPRLEDQPEIRPGEVTETHRCPTCHGLRHKVGWGPKAQRALMIYNTGHTADEVVKTKTGVTYIKGTMHHDAFLQEEGRRPEHREVELGDKWHVAVRNTVPRRRPRRQEEEVTT